MQSPFLLSEQFYCQSLPNVSLMILLARTGGHPAMNQPMMNGNYFVPPQPGPGYYGYPAPGYVPPPAYQPQVQLLIEISLHYDNLEH